MWTHMDQVEGELNVAETVWTSKWMAPMYKHWVPATRVQK